MVGHCAEGCDIWNTQINDFLIIFLDIVSLGQIEPEIEYHLFDESKGTLRAIIDQRFKIIMSGKQIFLLKSILMNEHNQ